ncbi:MAG: hypothetical protein NVSMB21_06090 [Vulcanimicrobiaceae bacterium]
MVKSLIFGGVAFATAYVLERRLHDVGYDIARYNRIRAMSGDPPLLRQGFGMLKHVIASLRDSRRTQTASLVSSLQSDLLRYVRISSM